MALAPDLDNLKAGILKFEWTDPDLNPNRGDFAQHCGITVLPCRPNTRDDDGKVENNIAYVRGNALAGRSLGEV